MNRILICMAALVYCATSMAGELKMEGVYYGKNLYFKNTAGTPDKFCAVSATVNGKSVGKIFSAAAFEIDFSAVGLNIGDKVSVSITYNDCKPEAVNAEVLRPSPTATYIYLKADKSSVNWMTVGENGPLAYKVQVSKWDRWVTVGELMGNGLPDTNTYKYEVKLNPGYNIFRLYQSDGKGIENWSDDFKVRSTSAEVTYTVNKSASITFSEATQYEIYDSAGNLLLEGESNEVDISSLEKGEYHMGYSNKAESFKK